MNHLQEKTRAKTPDDLSVLVCYQCPSCNMLTWRKQQLKGEVLCPFCCNRLPEYIAKISPQRMIVRDEKPKRSEKLLATPMKCNEAKPKIEEQNESPFITEFFMVQGVGFRCMAYRNGDGKWRGAFDNEELPGAVQILE